MPPLFNLNQKSNSVATARNHAAKKNTAKVASKPGKLLTLETPKPINYTNPIAAKIQQRRYQMLVHAYRYYELACPVIEDSTWDEWAKELYELQQKHPTISLKVRYAKEFADFDSSTGFDLPYNKPEIKRIVERLDRIAVCGE